MKLQIEIDDDLPIYELTDLITIQTLKQFKESFANDIYSNVDEAKENKKIVKAINLVLKQYDNHYGVF